MAAEGGKQQDLEPVEEERLLLVGTVTLSSGLGPIWAEVTCARRHMERMNSGNGKDLRWQSASSDGLGRKPVGGVQRS